MLGMARRKEDPVQSWRFLVEVGGKGGVSAAFAYFSGIKMNVVTVKSRDGNDIRGVQSGIPVLTQYGPVTLRKGVVGDNEFLDWLLSSSASLEAGPTGDNLKRDIDVVALNDKRERAVTWTLKNAMPIGYETSPMDANRSEVLMESITFSVGGVKRTVESASGA